MYVVCLDRLTIFACMLEIIHQDNYLLAINKPPGLLVHKSRIARDVSSFALQQVRDQTGMKVYPSHRLDRKTSGVLLFGLDNDTNRMMQKQFAEKKVHKSYLAIVRGYTNDSDKIDYALKREDGKMQNAVTHYKTLERSEIDVPFGKHQTSRYSLVEAMPETGRMHQIRKHFAHILHPIIGDRPHGCNKQNRLFKEKWGMTQMMLHAISLHFVHPIHQRPVLIQATPPAEFSRMMKLMNFTGYLLPSQRSDVS